jgi:hypothetical protein
VTPISSRAPARETWHCDRVPPATVTGLLGRNLTGFTGSAFGPYERKEAKTFQGHPLSKARVLRGILKHLSCAEPQPIVQIVDMHSYDIALVVLLKGWLHFAHLLGAPRIHHSPRRTTSGNLRVRGERVKDPTPRGIKLKRGTGKLPLGE